MRETCNVLDQLEVDSRTGGQLVTDLVNSKLDLKVPIGRGELDVSTIDVSGKGSGRWVIHNLVQSVSALA